MALGRQYLPAEKEIHQIANPLFCITIWIRFFYGESQTLQEEEAGPLTRQKKSIREKGGGGKKGHGISLLFLFLWSVGFFPLFLPRRRTQSSRTREHKGPQKKEEPKKRREPKILWRKKGKEEEEEEEGGHHRKRRKGEQKKRNVVWDE